MKECEREEVVVDSVEDHSLFQHRYDDDKVKIYAKEILELNDTLVKEVKCSGDDVK